jgi:hypothetical protein
MHGADVALSVCMVRRPSPKKSSIARWDLGDIRPSGSSSSALAYPFRLVRFFVRASLVSQLLLRRARRISGFEVRLGSHRVLLSSRYFRRLVCLQFHGRETGWESITRPNLSARPDLPETHAGVSSVKGRFRLVNRLALCHQHTSMMPALIFVLVLIFRCLLSFCSFLPAYICLGANRMRNRSSVQPSFAPDGY